MQETLSLPTTPQVVITRKTSALIEAYRTTPSVHTLFRSIKKLTTQASHEYGNRFLFELIQNAFDAHPESRRDGIIHIKLMRDEESNGVLYVANRGKPFGEPNFEAICQLAQSSKVPGEGIGNKGVGFRSVLQICKWPEVYSASQGNDGSAGFAGFCFGFAGPEAVRSLVLDNDALCRGIISDVSPYALPVAITKQGATVKGFSRHGFATVVRLPLKSEAALVAVEQQMDLLRNATAPVMLFLDRLSKLVIEDELGGKTSRFELTRNSDTPPLAHSDEHIVYEVVDLGSQGRFFVAKWQVEEDRLRKSIEESVEKELLPSEWSDWKGAAWVSVAARTDSEEGGSHCLYNFLPMSRANSPFHGYLNAPFYAKTDRTDLHDDVPLNAFFMDIAAALCERTITYLKRVQADYAAMIIIDLLTWSARKRIEQAFTDAGGSLWEAEIISVLHGRNDRKWAGINAVYKWFRHDLRYINAKVIARSTNAELLNPKIGLERAERLSVFCSEDSDLDPPPEELASWVEEVAKYLLHARFNASHWNSFYDDISQMFSTDAEVLAGRKILLGADHQLHRCAQTGAVSLNKGGAVVFFPPTRTRADGNEVVEEETNIQVPASLTRYICYMHPDLTWVEAEGRTRRQKSSRVFFEARGLIKAYETRALLENIALLLAKTKSDSVRSDALKWTFSLQQVVNYNQRPGLDELNLYVPTASGWIPAKGALLSSEWPRSNGPLLQKLIRETKSLSPELGDIEQRFILPPEDWPFNLADLDTWTSFLRRVGVRDGLWPIRAFEVEEERDGSFLRQKQLNFISKLDPPERECWINEANAPRYFPDHPQTPYRVKGIIWRLPGQLDYSKLSEPSRKTYAQLIVAGLAQWPDSMWTLMVHRPNHPNKPDQMKWPSPVCAFLKQTPWLPMSRPGDREKWDFYIPPKAWHFSESDDDVAPIFAPLVPRSLRRLIDKDKKCQDILKTHLKLKVWNDRAYCAQLVVFLGRLISSQDLGDLSADSFRKAYVAAWADVIETGKDPFSSGVADKFLVVSRGGKLSVTHVDGEDGGDNDPVYIMDGDDGLRLNLLEGLGLPVFNIGEKHGNAVAKILTPLLGERARLVSSTPLSILVDGAPFDPNPALKPLVTSDNEWLKTLAVLTLEFRSVLPAHRSERTKQSITRRLGQVRLKTTRSISIRIDGQDSPLPLNVGGVIAVEHDDFPTLIVTESADELNWHTLERIAGPLARLIGHSSLAVPLQLALVLLARQKGERDVFNPTDADFALAFNEKEERVREIRHGLKGSAIALLENLRPVVYHYAGAEAAEQFNEENEELSTEESILIALSTLTADLGTEPKAIVDACREADSLSDLRDRLGISYADFNRALSSLGPPYQPIRNPEAHENALRYFKQRHREGILGSLRQTFLSDFQAGRVLTEYAGLRQLDSLVPDPTWLDVCDTPDENMLLKRTNEWLAAAKAAPLGGSQGNLAPFDEVRRENSKVLDFAMKKMMEIVPIWCWKYAAQVPPMWVSADPVAQIRQLTEADCLLDFEILTAADVISWMVRKGHWPNGMPQSTDREALGITTEDVETKAKQIEAQKNLHDLERRSIRIDGRPVLAEPENYSMIADLIARTITPEFLVAPKRMSKLEELAGHSKRRGTARPTWGSGSRSRRPTEQLLNAVGLIGEVLVFHWLKHQYGEAWNDDSWKSTYKNHVLGGSTGSDSLGYDFEIVQKRGTLLFEVKASASDRMEIEMGETEVEQAQRNHANNRYRIIYVSNVLDPVKRFIRVLPNPFSNRGRGFYRLAGTGLRYQFKLHE